MRVRVGHVRNRKFLTLGGLTTLEHRVVNESFSILIPTLAGGHLGTLGGLITLEHRVVIAPILSISTLAGGYPGTLGSLITLEHRVIAAPILLSSPPLLKATEEHWVASSGSGDESRIEAAIALYSRVTRLLSFPKYPPVRVKMRVR